MDVPPEDNIFDGNVLTIAIGLPEHNSCGIDFINAVVEIKRTCPLSFSAVVSATCPPPSVPSNAGLPNTMGSYDEDPEIFAADIYDCAKDGILNFVLGAAEVSHHTMLPWPKR